MANELGYRTALGSAESDHSRSVSNAFKGSIYALVALLLGFSFSSTTGRYNLRQRIVLDQSNAIGTCFLRAGLLAQEPRDRIQGILRRYVAVRLEQQQTGLDSAAFAQAQAEIDKLLQELWTAVESANQLAPESVRNSFIVQAANDVIDLSSTRAWANRNHLPESVLLLLTVGVVLSCFLLGHSSGQATQRHLSLWLTSNLLLGLVLFVILDFDRPQRGLIQVDLNPLIQLDATIRNPPAP